MTQRLYHVVVINERTGAKTVVTAHPMPHAQANENRKRFSHHPARRIQLEEVRALPYDESAAR